MGPRPLSFDFCPRGALRSAGSGAFSFHRRAVPVLTEYPIPPRFATAPRGNSKIRKDLQPASLGAACGAPVGHDDPACRLLGTTCITSIGWGDRPRRVGWSTDRGGCGASPAGFHPHFLFGAPKRKRRWSRQKKKRFSLRSYGRGAPSRAAGRGSKLFCPINAAPTGARAEYPSDFRTQYAVLHSSVIGQRPNLTSSSFRAFCFAKRCLGGRGGLPLFDGLCADSRPSLAAAGADASLRAGWLGWLIGLSVGADDLTDAPNFGTKFGWRRPCPRYGGPNPRPS